MEIGSEARSTSIGHLNVIIYIYIISDFQKILELCNRQKKAERYEMESRWSNLVKDLVLEIYIFPIRIDWDSYKWTNMIELDIEYSNSIAMFR